MCFALRCYRWQGALYLPMTMSLSADGDLLVAPDARVLSAKRVEPAIYNCDEIFEVSIRSEMWVIEKY